MTPIDALFELLRRVGACQGIAVLVNVEELHQWPGVAVKAMKSQRLIVKARPADSAICPGCEDNCVMPVHRPPAAAGARSSFIVCDKRSDINRVSVSSERLTQWQCSVHLVCEFVTSSLGLRPPARKTGSAGRWEIGIASGDKRSQMLCLEATDILALVAGNNKVPLDEFVEFHKDKYALDEAKVLRMVDAATTADNRYTPSQVKREARKLQTQARYESWQKEYRKLKRIKPGNPDTRYAQQIAKMDIADGRDAETIRRHMKK
jgi:hypothetical protein